MHDETLSAQQTNLLPLVQSFSSDFYLVGRTAIALQIGHRQSIDFDLFSNKDFDNFKLRRKILQSKSIERVIRDEKGDYTVIIDGVRFTFFYYPFQITSSKSFSDIVAMPDLLTLAAMKAYALGRRAKWKDYVDLYFILKDHCSIEEIVNTGRKIFGAEFNEKIFRVQLSYFEDIDHTEKVLYSQGFEVPDEVIKKELIAYSIS